MKRKSLLTMMLMLLFVATAWAQRTVTGTIRDEAGEGLPGATVQIKGTTKGTVADIEGKYSIQVDDENAVLVFSFVNYKTKEITVGSQTVIDVSLESSLSEVIVTGYTGNKTVEELTSSISQIKGEEIAQVPIADVNQLIQGRAAGIQATSSTGQPGAVAQVRVRGTASISASTRPLYVIDGVIVQDYQDISSLYNTNNGTSTTQSSLTQDPLANINPNDIASMEILKDATAVALYGSRGANGVIIVTTKSGSQGKTKFDLRTQYGITRSNTQSKYRPLTSAELVPLYRTALEQTFGFSPEQAASFFPDELLQTETNWVDEAFRVGSTQSYDLSASGGSGKTSFFISGGYFSQEGILIGSSFDRYTGRLNLNHQANDKLSFGAQLNLSYVDRLSASPGNQFNSPILGAYINLPWDSPRDPETGELVDGTNFDGLVPDNFVRTTALNNRTSGTFRSIANLNLSYTIIDGLTFESKLGTDFINLQEKSYTDPTTPDGFQTGPGVDGRITQGNTEVFTITTTNLLRYAKSLNETSKINALVGFETQSNKNNTLGGSGVGLANGLLRNLNSVAIPESVFGSGTGYAIVSLLSNVEYSYMDKYIVKASLRRDGSSRFGQNNKYATFWALGGAWNVSRESFLEDNPIVNLLKLRASYGISGNADFDSNFPSLTLYGYSAGYNNQPAAIPSQLGNPDLAWERTAQLDLGLDFEVIERVSGSIDVYNRESVDLLLAVPVPSTTGFTTRNANIGKVRNRGIELQITTRNTTGVVKWNTDFMFASNKNEVLELPNGNDIPDGFRIIREGEQIGSFYLREYAGADPETGRPRWIGEDGEYTFNYSQAPRKIVGSANPKWYGSINNTVSFKGLEFSALIYTVQGNKIYNGTGRIVDSDGAFVYANQSAATLEDRWQQPGDIATRPQFLWGGNNNANQSSTRYLEDGSFVRLRNVVLAYNLPKELVQRAKLAKVRAYVQGTNLLTFTKYTGFDPELAENGEEFFRYPNGKAITFGLDISF